MAESRMVQGDFDSVYDSLKESEGGFVNNPKDPGGATNHGITLNTYRRLEDKNADVDTIKNMSKEKAKEFYKKHFWDSAKIDKLPREFRLVAFDAAVNSGAKRGTRFIQQGLKNAGFDIDVDDQMGPGTIEALKKAVSEGKASEVVEKSLDARLDFMKKAVHRKTGEKLWKTFGKGWQNRVDRVRKEAQDFIKSNSEVIDQTSIETTPGGLVAGSSDQNILRTAPPQDGRSFLDDSEDSQGEIKGSVGFSPQDMQNTPQAQAERVKTIRRGVVSTDLLSPAKAIVDVFKNALPEDEESQRVRKVLERGKMIERLQTDEAINREFYKRAKSKARRDALREELGEE